MPSSPFPNLPGQSGYHKWLRSLLLGLEQAARALAVDIDFWFDNTADEIERVRRLLDDVLGIGGLLVRRYVATATA